MEKLRAFFEYITSFKPFGDYQIKPAQHLANGDNVVLRMPTGSGKFEATLCAFLWSLHNNTSFPQQMIYGLPMRTLVNSLGIRCASYQKNFEQLNVAIQHGANKGTPRFLSDIAFATIDQIISAYACVPLGHPVRSGNIPAGAISSAFLAFDEVHTFDPRRSMQSMLFMLEHGNKLNIPFALLSATLPDAFLDALDNQFSIKIIDVLESEIPVRSNRCVILKNCLDTLLSPHEIVNAWKNDCPDGRLLVVCNTVKQAQDLWLATRHRLPDVPVEILHSCYTPSDRSDKEKILDKWIGKEPSVRGIVITTQVVEVGLDVSVNILLTELAPVDALIQRAGRVARWGGHGEIRIYGVEKVSPYLTDLIDETRSALPTKDVQLDWILEKSLVNTVLGPVFATYLQEAKRGEAIYWLGEGTFSGKRSDVSKAIRNNQSCTVSIHDSPNTLKGSLWTLPQIRFNVWNLQRFARENGTGGIKHVVTDANPDRSIDDKATVEAVSISVPDLLFPGEFYVLHPSIARYEPEERGLLLGEIGKSMPIDLQRSKTTGFIRGASQRESWLHHCENVLEVFYTGFEPRYEAALHSLSQCWKLSYDDFIARIALCIALHDLGKLGLEWQKKIGRGEKEDPLGHSGDNAAAGKLPPHATVSAYMVQDMLYSWGRIREPLLCAIAHHHSVRAIQVPKYRMIPEWKEQTDILLSHIPASKQLWNTKLVETFEIQTAPTELAVKIPDISAQDGGRAWRTYTVISRILRLSDQMATAGRSEYALLRDENWLTDV